MKIMKKLAVAGIAVFILATGSVTAFAASQYATLAGAVAGLTGRNVQSVIDERVQTGKTYGTIADEAGVLDEFKMEMLELKKDTLAARVAAGTMTEQQASAVIAKIEANQAKCDGTGTGRGLNGAGCGMEAGFGQGRGQGGHGMGNGLHDGSCLNR